MARFQELTSAEKARLLVWLDWTQQHLASTLSPAPDAFNLGVKGPAAGQTIPQFHLHIIPRYTGDVPDPRGGVRQVIPAKACAVTETGLLSLGQELSFVLFSGKLAGGRGKAGFKVLMLAKVFDSNSKIAFSLR